MPSINAGFNGEHDAQIRHRREKAEQETDFIFKATKVVFVLAGLVSLAVIGVVIWAVVALVSHFTG